MPARITGGESGVLMLAAQGAIPTQITLTGANIDAVVPWLATGGPISDAHWTIGSAAGAIALPIKPLADDERLVAYCTDANDAARLGAELFAGTRIIPVALDLSRPVLTPAAAYEALDAVILDPATAGRVTEAQLAVLLAGGTSVLIRSESRPTGDWPWARHDGYWVLRYAAVGPSPLIEPGVYTPTYSWVHGWSSRTRWQAVLMVAAFSILALGLSLWRSRLMLVAMPGLCLAATGAIFVWTARLSPVLSAGGAVLWIDPPLIQQDQWSYRSVLRPAEAAVPFEGLTHPVFSGPRQMRAANLRLICDAVGRPTMFSAHLETDHTLAFLSRTIHPSHLGATPVKPITSPLFVLADQLYPGHSAGQLPPVDNHSDNSDRNGHWPTVVIRRPLESAVR